MPEIIAAAVVLVGVLAAADFLLTFAVIRRLAALERGTGTPPADAGISPPIGYRIGDFRVPLASGGEFTRADLAGNTVTVMFVTTGCQPCKEAIAELRSQARPLPSPLYVLVAGADHDHVADGIMRDLTAAAHVGTVAIEGSVTESFAVTGFPTALVIEDGVVHASGLRISGLPHLVRQ